jgi:VanZ family protein
MRINKKIVLSWAAVILWMLMIFVFSAQPAAESEKVSHGATSIILKFIENLAIISGVSVDLIEKTDHLVRKLAHAFVFFVLAMLVVNAFLKTGVKGFRVFIFAFIVTSLYACTDEIHQMFVPGRACRLSDVGIDSMGAMFGLCLFGAVCWLNCHTGIDLSERINTAVYKLNVFRSLRTNNE